MAANDHARAAASHTPGSAGATTDDLTARRLAKAIELAAQIAASKRDHPSRRRVYDQEAE